MILLSKYVTKKAGYKPVKYSVTQCKCKIFEFLGWGGGCVQTLWPPHGYLNWCLFRLYFVWNLIHKITPFIDSSNSDIEVDEINLTSKLHKYCITVYAIPDTAKCTDI